MVYIALYRKYRPERFSDVVGQEHIKRTLKNAIKKDQLSHAYLFSGPRGTGKTTIARILARATNCIDLHDGEPCGKCDNCRGISSGVWGVVEIDGASHNSVEDIRDLQDVIHHVPLKGKYTVYIIDEVHMLSKPAFNAFLKTLEEPPVHAKFIMCTTEPFKLPKTILSRCQHFSFTHIPLAEIKAQVEKIAAAEKVEISTEAAEFLAVHGQGSMRDTISLLDQALIYAGGKIRIEDVKELLGAAEESLIGDTVDAIIAGDAEQMMRIIDTAITKGIDLPEISRGVASYLRNLLLVIVGIRGERILGFIGEELPRLEKQSKKVTEKLVMKALEHFGEVSAQMRYDIDQRLALETALLGAMTIFKSPDEEPPKKAVEPKAPERVSTPFPERTPVTERQSTAAPPAPKSDKGVLRRASTKPGEESPPKDKPAPKPPEGFEKKNPVDDFPGFWNSFLNFLRSENLPVMVIVKDANPHFDGTTISLIYPRKLEYQYHFAVQDKVPSRLEQHLKSYSEIGIKVAIKASETDETPDKETLLDPGWVSEVDKAKLENLKKDIEENLLPLFEGSRLINS